MKPRPLLSRKTTMKNHEIDVLEVVDCREKMRHLIASQHNGKSYKRMVVNGYGVMSVYHGDELVHTGASSEHAAEAYNNIIL